MTDTKSWNDMTSNPELEGYDPDVGKRERLPEDNDTPGAYANEVRRELPPDHPVTDSEIDYHEAYDAGLTNSTGIRAQDEVEDDKSQALYGGQ
jgi:hypothetical protein